MPAAIYGSPRLSLPFEGFLLMGYWRGLSDASPRYLHLGSRPETAYGRMTKVLALTIPAREMIIRAHDEPPPGLEELPGVLLREHAARASGQMA